MIDPTALTVKVATIEVSDAKSFEDAAAVLLKIKDAEKELKARKELLTKPMNEALKSARALFATWEDGLDDAKRLLQKRMTDFKNQEDLKVEAEQERLEEAGDPSAASLSTLRSIATPSGLREVTRREVVIVDESLIPKEYFVLDRVKLNADALGNKAQNIEPKVIPGIVIKEVKEVK